MIRALQALRTLAPEFAAIYSERGGVAGHSRGRLSIRPWVNELGHRVEEYQEVAAGPSRPPGEVARRARGPRIAAAKRQRPRLPSILEFFWNCHIPINAPPGGGGTRGTAGWGGLTGAPFGIG